MGTSNGINKRESLVVIGQAADILGVSVDTVRRWDNEGHLHASRPNGKTRYFSIEELERVKLAQPLSIAEASSRLDMSPSTLRRLEDKGLISPKRNAKGDRLYDRSTLQKFLDSNYFMRQKDVEEKVLKPLHDNNVEDEKHAHDTVAQALLGEHHVAIKKLHRFRKVSLWSVLIAAGAYLAPIAITTLCFLLFPDPTARWFGYFKSATALNKQFTATPESSLMARQLRPLSDTALSVVQMVNPDLRERIDPTKPIKDINDVLTPDSQGDITSRYTFSVADTSYLHIPDQGLIVNLNSDFVRGKHPGAGSGDLAVLPIDTNYVKDGAITIDKLSSSVRSFISSSRVGTTTVVTAPTTSGGLTGIVAGPGLKGGGTSGAPQLSIDDSVVRITSSPASGDVQGSFVGGLSLVASGVGAGAYGTSNSVGTFTVDSKGRITTASTTAIAIDASAVATGTLSLSRGGTNAVTAVGARANLGAAASGVNTDITSLTGLTAALPVTEGGTGADSFTANGLLYGNGTSALQATAAGTAGQLLITNASAVPAFVGLTGDATLASSGNLTLMPAGVTAGSYGTASSVSSFTVDAKGRIINAVSTPIALDTSALTTGTLTVVRGGTGQSSYTDGQLLIGNSSTNGLSKATLAAGSGVTITNGNGSITIAASGAGTCATCANQALSNLNGVSISSSLLTGAATIDLGSGVNPFRDLYLGGATTNNFRFTGTASSARTLTMPDASGTLAVSASGNIALSGTGNITVTGLIQLTNGGTNASTASGARTNLGAAASGTNGDITSLTGLTTALSVGQGGTGAISFTSNGLIYGNGTGALQVTAVGTAGQLLLANASAVPTFTTLSGDATLASSGALTLASSGVAAASYGSASSVATFTVDAKGRITTASTTAIAIDAGAVSTGALAVARGGTGQASYTDGQLLIGNTTSGSLNKATLTAGSGITITNGNGSITIASSSSSPAMSTLQDSTAANTLNSQNRTQTWNWNTLTSQQGLVLGSSSSGTGGSQPASQALTSGGLLSVGDSSTRYQHTLIETGTLETLTFTDQSANTLGASTTNGLLVNSTINTTGAGTKTVNGLAVGAPTFTGCATGACTWEGMSVTTQSSSNSLIIQNGVNIAASGIVAGTLNGVNISGITAGGGTQTAINIGRGWNNALSIDPSVTGTSMNVSFASAATQTGALTGLNLDFSTNLTGAAATNITALQFSTPTLTTTSGTTIYNGVATNTVGAIQNSTAGSFTWNGLSFTIPSITQGAGGSVTANGLKITTGTITTNGTENGLTIAASGVGAGTLNGINISGITAGAGTQTGLNIGRGWNNAIAIDPSVTGTSTIYQFASAATQTGALTGINLDFNTNLTGAAGNNITALQFSTPALTTTSSTTTYNGIATGTTGAIQNSTAGSFRWNGLNLSTPNITQGSGGSVTADGIKLANGSITTSGTQNSIEIADSGVGAGSLNGINIDNITAGAGTQTAIQIGTGWNQGLTIGVTPNASTGRTIDVAGNWGGSERVDISSATSTQTITESQQALVYDLESNTNLNGFTITFNITGLPDTDGTYAFIYTKCTGPTPIGQASSVVIKVNGNPGGGVSTTTCPSLAGSTIKSYTLVRINGVWRVMGAAGAADTADLAEWTPFMGERPQPGDVVTLASPSSGQVRVKKTDHANDRGLVGVVSTAPNTVMADEQPDRIQLALAGRVPVKVSTENGPIRVGDYLTSSSTPGVAMRAIKAGPVVGKAMESYSGVGVGTVTMFVNTSYYAGASLEELVPPGIGITAGSDTYRLGALDYLKKAQPSLANLNEVSADRVVAGLDVISPNVTTDNLHVSTISSNGSAGITFRNSQGATIATLDRSGVGNFNGIEAQDVRANQIVSTDIGEKYLSHDNNIEVGSVVALDPANPDFVTKSTLPYAPRLAGVVSSAPSMIVGQDRQGDGSDVVVALGGRVSVKVSDEGGPIAPGDPLTSSSTPGVAMKAAKEGPIIGRALVEYTDRGVGTVLALVANGYGSGPTTQALEALSARFSNLAHQVTDSQTQSDSRLEKLEQRIAGLETQGQTLAAGQTRLQQVATQQINVTLDLKVNGSLTVDGLAVFEGDTVFQKSATFKGDITINGHPTVNSDTAGHAQIKSGQTITHVAFEKEYTTPPVISLSLGNGTFAEYSYTNLTTKGFDIVVASPATQDLAFSWIALQGKSADSAVR